MNSTQTENPGECGYCGFETKELMSFDAHDPKEWICKLCAGSTHSTAACFVGNMILKRLDEIEKKLKEK